LTSSCCNVIAKIITSDKIKSLNLCENFLDDNTMQAIIRSLNINTSLETLSLHDNPISMSTIENFVQAFIERTSTLLLELPAGYTSQFKKKILTRTNEVQQVHKDQKSLQIVFGKSYKDGNRIFQSYE